ncbi:hypothetical protein ACFWBR_29135 [Streptomyces sp. NPDC060006]|uniref:hypothetical protein n=1 Tax=unclassified Streptomyces TaxID=2593676 RepID=UPI0036A5A2E1
MSSRQVRKMFQLMAGGEPVELTSPMASVKKLARLAYIAEQFGYQYADVRQGGGNNSALKMLIVPDASPQARARAAQNWAQFPQASGGGPLPPFVPDALELLKARINFDLTGKSAEKRMAWGAVGFTVGCVILALRTGGDGIDFAVSGVFWVVLMGVLGLGLVVTRKRNAKFAARLQAAGFIPVTDETGRVRYLSQGLQMPGGQLPGSAPGQGNPFGAQYGQQSGHQYGSPYGNPHGVPPADAPAPGPYAPQAPGPYAPQAPGPYAGQQGPGPYAQPQPQFPPQAQPYPQVNPYGQAQPPQ